MHTISKEMRRFLPITTYLIENYLDPWIRLNKVCATAMSVVVLGCSLSILWGLNNIFHVI